MLNDVTAFMRGNGSGGDASLAVDSLTKVDSLSLGVVMIRELAWHAGNLNISYPVVHQHFPSDLRSCHPVRGRNLGILVKPAVESGLDHVAQYHHHNSDNPYQSVTHNIVFYYWILRRFAPQDDSKAKCCHDDSKAKCCHSERSEESLQM